MLKQREYILNVGGREVLYYVSSGCRTWRPAKSLLVFAPDETAKDAEPTIYSYVEGLHIHFNSTFTSVWVNNSVKPTLSYRVINPQKAKLRKFSGSTTASPASII